MQNLILQKFGHEHCGPCRTIKPVLEQVAEKYKDVLIFQDLDTMAMGMEDLVKANIKGVPTMILLKDGVEVWRQVGLIPKTAIEAVIDRYVSQIPQ